MNIVGIAEGIPDTGMLPFVWRHIEAWISQWGCLTKIAKSYIHSKSTFSDKGAQGVRQFV